LSDWVTDVIDRLGYTGVAFLVALENILPPIPSEVVLPFAGFAAGRGDAWVVGMIVAATVGSLVGAWVLYGIAAWVGDARLHAFVDRHGRWFGVKVSDLGKAEAWFDKRQGTAVLICRCVPLVRSLVSIPAGFRRMDPLRFTLYTVLGSLVWNSALIIAGYVLGDQWEKVEGFVSWFQWVVVGAIAVAIVWWAWMRILKPRLRGEPTGTGGPGPT
jgi:membrane protein DedA with SNARE-associated domain